MVIGVGVISSGGPPEFSLWEMTCGEKSDSERGPEPGLHRELASLGLATLFGVVILT